MLSLLGGLTHPNNAQAQKVKSTPFSYLPEQGADRYDMRVPRKTLPLADGSGFVILAHQSSGSYSVERYDADLKKQWSTTIPINPGETVEAFGRGTQQALVVLHHKDDNGQNLTLVPVNLQGGQKAAPKVLMAVAPRDRRPGVSISPDGSRVLAFRYFTREQQVKSMAATLFDQSGNKIEEKNYDFRALGDFFSPAVHVANDGTQYVTLISEGMKKLTVRRYPTGPSTEIKVLGVPVGGVFGGKTVTVRDAKFTVLGDGSLYAAAICADYATGEYYSLKVVRFDFSGSGDMKFSPEFRFTPEYLAEVAKAGGVEAKRLEDIYLADLLLTPDKQLVVIGERHFEVWQRSARARPRVAPVWLQRVWRAHLAQHCGQRPSSPGRGRLHRHRLPGRGVWQYRAAAHAGESQQKVGPLPAARQRADRRGKSSRTAQAERGR